MGTQKNRLNEHPKHKFKLVDKKIITILSQFYRQNFRLSGHINVLTGSVSKDDSSECRSKNILGEIRKKCALPFAGNCLLQGKVSILSIYVDFIRRHLFEVGFRPYDYSKPCVKRPLKNRQNKDLYDKWYSSVMKVESIAECSPWSILR